MPFQISPGVNVTEIDLTTIVPAISTTVGGIAGRFHWGPVDKTVLITTEDELAETFGKPTSDNAEEWFTAASFLAYSNQLYVSRAENAANNASAAGVGRYVKNDDDYEANYLDTGVPGAGNWVAKYPGLLGNSLKVSICQSASAWESTVSSANLAFNAANTIIGTMGANTDTANTTHRIDISGNVAVGDLLYAANSTVSFQLQIASVNTSAIVVSTAPTEEELGNTVLVSSSVLRRWEYYNFFDGPPGTSDYATTHGGSGDELHVAVVDEDGDWTGIQGTVIARHPFVSRANDALGPQGGSLYYKNVINLGSPYIWWAAHDSILTSAGSPSTTTFTNSSDVPITESLSGANTGNAPTNAQLINAYDLYIPDQLEGGVDVSILLGADANQTIATHIVQNIAEFRKDMVVTLSPERTDVVNNTAFSTAEQEDIIAFRNTLPSSSYAILDSGWKYMYDKYNDSFRYIPLNGDIGGLMVVTDSLRDPWFSPAGFNRGNIKNVVRLAYNPPKAERDQLYKNGINPVVTFPGQGTVLFGDKTMLSKPSAFDRINVRRLFIVLEKAIAKAAEYTLFEFNDEFTRAQFRNLVEPFLRDVQGRRGIFDFRVVCDETNNTPEIIDRNEFVGDIYIKPARSINFIQLNFIAVRTGVAFEEVVGTF